MTPKLAVVGDRADIKALDHIHAAASNDHGPSQSRTISAPSSPETVLSAAQPNMKDGSCKGSQETHNKLTGQSENPRLASPS